MSQEKKELSELLSELPTGAVLTVVDREEVCGFCVSYSEAGFGFGEITFLLDKKTGEITGDTECTSPDHVGRILQRLVGTVVKGVEPA